MKHRENVLKHMFAVVSNVYLKSLLSFKVSITHEILFRKWIVHHHHHLLLCDVQICCDLTIVYWIWNSSIRPKIWKSFPKDFIKKRYEKNTRFYNTSIARHHHIPTYSLSFSPFNLPQHYEESFISISSIKGNMAIQHCLQRKCTIVVSF